MTEGADPSDAEGVLDAIFRDPDEMFAELLPGPDGFHELILDGWASRLTPAQVAYLHARYPSGISTRSPEGR